MIDYNLLSKSVEFYKAHDFTYIEVPWYVSEEIKNCTRPINKDKSTDYKLSVNDKYLIASGEQGFLYLMAKGFIANGLYQTITPCFRYEEIDILHKKVFMKNELISILDHRLTNDSDINYLVESIMIPPEEFFNNYFNDKVEIVQVPQETSILNYDIMYKGIELGSYGYREYKGLYWIYGTGCAEPRTSNLIKDLYENI